MPLQSQSQTQTYHSTLHLLGSRPQLPPHLEHITILEAASSIPRGRGRTFTCMSASQQVQTDMHQRRIRGRWLQRAARRGSDGWWGAYGPLVSSVGELMAGMTGMLVNAAKWQNMLLEMETGMRVGVVVVEERLVGVKGLREVVKVALEAVRRR